METRAQDNSLDTDDNRDPSTTVKKTAATSQPNKIQKPHNKTPPASRPSNVTSLAPMYPSFKE